jgi:glycosyltransferase involved in cell wall biosynthesis
MKIALVHDSLAERGGPERVVLQMAEALDNPVVVTTTYDPARTFSDFATLPVHALDEMPHIAKRSGPRPASALFRSLDLARADLVVISSTGFAHHVSHPRSAVYWHNLPDLAGTPDDHDTGAAPLPRTVTAPLRRQDVLAAMSHPLHLANSQRTADQLRARYGIDADVLHPVLDMRWLGTTLTEAAWPPRALVVSRLVPDNRVDVVIAACREIGLPLTVVGEGPELRRLIDFADSSVVFVSSLSDAALATAYRSHAVIICPQHEHFGLVPLEALYAGRPVVASSSGGAMESVLHRETGWLVGGFNPTDWARALTQVLQRRWDPALLRSSVARFTANGAFDDGIAAWLGALVACEEAMRARPISDRELSELMAS